MTQGNAALIGKLDGVAEEVEQDLPQPCRVAARSGACGWLDQDTEVDALSFALGPNLAGWVDLPKRC
jgi:hypothetical protein